MAYFMLRLLIFLECSSIGVKLEIIPQIFKMNFTKTLTMDSESSFLVTALSTRSSAPRLMYFLVTEPLSRSFLIQVAEVNFTQSCGQMRT